MKTFTRDIHRRAFLRATIFLSAAIIASIACNLPQFPTPTPTPAPATIPAGWVCYTNATYGFEVCYPPDATFSSSTPEHARISFPVTAGTNLAEKWMDVDAASGLSTCVSPQAAGYAPGTTNDTHRTIAGLDFLVQSGSQGAAGNFYNWMGYSTQRAAVCASLSGVVHTTDALNYPTPPPTIDPAAESVVFDQITATFRWLEAPGATQTATPTPAVTAGIPAGWLCYTNATYAFEVCYPSDATLSDETPAHVRIHLTIAADTNLLEKWMDVDGSNAPPVCQSPQAAGYDPAVITTSHRAIAGLDFLVQKASEGAAGSIYQWTGYSTQRGDVCASLTGVLHSGNPGNYSTPPPLFNQAAESVVFDQIAATFRWLEALGATPTATSTPALTNTPTQTASGLKFIDPWISTDHFYYPGASCGPVQVQFQIGVSQPDLVQSIGIFFQLKDKSSGDLSGWSQGDAMSPMGGGKYLFTLILDDLPGHTTLKIKEAWLQYQFVANDKGGTPLLHSDVFANVTLAFCAVIAPSGK
jgi:hypothetical protein